ncbi:MAG: zinc-binding dehydrogenase, partial [Mycobacterium sp.]
LQSRRDAASTYGAVGVDPEADEVVGKVKELTGGGASYAIDTTAISAVVKQAQQSLRSRGTLIALGLGAEEYTIDALTCCRRARSSDPASRATPTRERWCRA